MHFAFIPWGARQEVERLFRDMEAQSMLLKLTKEGEKDTGLWIKGQVRLLPFGVVEYIFPKEYKDIVLNTMCDNTAPNRYVGLKPKVLSAMLQKALNLQKLPERNKKTKEKFLWCIEHVHIMPLGIREDSELVEPKDMGYKGWLHESL